MVVTLALATFALFIGTKAFPLLADVSRPSILFPRTTCGISGPQTCQNTTAQTNLCCFEAPGGQLQLVQLWDTDVPGSPANSWTIHGLWPDHCDGTYSQNCDSSRNYPSITTVLQNNGKQSLVDYMKQYWLNEQGQTELFWSHEWNTHGTCVSTIRPTCLPTGSLTGADAAAFFQRTVDTFKSLPTFTYFADAGISPSSSKTYTYDTLANAIKGQWGYTPALDCTSSTMYQISYVFNLKGSLIDGTLVPVDAPSKGSCPTSGIKWPPKTVSTPTSTTSTGGSSPTGIPARATISGLTSSGSSVGCLLTAGTWSTQTCATLTIISSGSGFTLKSSKGLCAASSSGLVCGSTVTTGTIFTATTSGGALLLTYSESTSWTADAVPSGTTQVTLYPGSARSQDLTLVINSA